MQGECDRCSAKPAFLGAIQAHEPEDGVGVGVWGKLGRAAIPAPGGDAPVVLHVGDAVAARILHRRVTEKRADGVAPIDQHELALVIGAPQVVGCGGYGQGGALGLVARAAATAAANQSVPIEHGVDGADGRQMYDFRPVWDKLLEERKSQRPA